MSLINQMLRDLEKRNTENGQNPALTQQVHVTVPPPVSKLPALGWNLLAVCALIAGYQGYQYVIAKPVKTEAAPQQIAKPVNNAIAVQANQPPAASQPVAMTTPIPVPQPVAPAVQTAPITPALSTQPALMPVAANQPVPDTLAPATAQPTQAAVPVSPAPKRKLKSKSVESTQHFQIDVVDSEPAVWEGNAVKPSKYNKGNPKQRAEMLYREALNHDEDYLAIAALEKALAFYPQHLNARLLLAKALHRSGQIDKTVHFLDESLALFPGNPQFINTRAQLYLQQKNPRAALNTLQRAGDEGRSEETYLSLMAAAYQQLQAYGNAGKIYQQLVAINPAKAENWLGLAVAAEKSSDKTMAIEAYQQALSRNSLKPSVVNFINQRLTALR